MSLERSMLTARRGETNFTKMLISPGVVHRIAFPGNLCAALYGYLALSLPIAQFQRRWEMTLRYDSSIYELSATRNMSCYYTVESVLCRLSSRLADLEFESFDLMAVSVPDQGSIDSFSTVYRGYLVSFPGAAPCHEHAPAFSVWWCIHDNNSFVHRCWNLYCQRATSPLFFVLYGSPLCRRGFRTTPKLAKT